MNIVSTAIPNKEVVNISNTFSTLDGVNVYRWNPKQKPVFSMLQDIQPELIFCSNEDIDAAFLSAMKRYPNTKLAIFGAGCHRDIENERILMVPHDTKDAIIRNIANNHFKLNPSANILQCRKGIFNRNWQSDILYVLTSVITVKVTNILYPLHETDYRFYICGNQNVSMPEYVGHTSIPETMNLMASTKMVLDIDYNSMFEAAINKFFCISNKSNDLFPSFANDMELKNLIEKSLADKRYRHEIASDAYKVAIDNHTCIHETMKFCEAFGYEHLINNLTNLLKKLK